MQVNFFATFRPLVGAKSIQINLPANATPALLLEALIRTYPALQGQLLDETGNLFSHVHFFINGRDVLHLPQLLQTPLSPEDKIDIFPPVGGGAIP